MGPITNKHLAGALLVVLVTIEALLEASDLAKATENVTNNCKKFELKSIKEFQAFVGDLKFLETSGNLAKTGGGADADNLEKICFRHKESLYALDDLIRQFDKQRACKFNEISKLEQYAKRYLSGRDKSPIGLKFFSLFGVHVGFICQLNLLAHVKQADLEVEQMDFIYSMASPTGWNVLINEHTKKSMKFGASGKANDVVNRVAKLIPGLNNVGQLSYLDFNHQMSRRNGSEAWTGIESGSCQLESSNLASKVDEFLGKIIKSCQNLDQFYVNSILSLAKLNHLGLIVNFDILNQYQENNLILHKWLAAASFCQLLIRVKSHPNDSSINFEILHDDKLLDSRLHLYSYVAELGEEIHPKAAELAWTASVGEATWNQESGALFRADLKEAKVSVAQEQLSQFIRGLERDYKSAMERAQEG